ncbi:MAG: hypothetical protein HYX92_08895 [Chloroflexi bacterium]|nr:hypothetical protein [Chloroflexota bacterium]
MKVADLSLEELRALIDEMLEEKLEAILGDPDRGLELREEVRERLKKSLAAVKRGERGIPAEQVAKELGLEW